VDAVPELKLTADLSHWVCVCERLLESSEIDIVKKIAPRVHHIHARVGYEEGPQVPDPRAPEWKAHVEAHEQWWKIIWETQFSSGMKTTTVTPEYGPPDYLHTLPYTMTPVAKLWDICNWAKDRLRANFENCKFHK